MLVIILVVVAVLLIASVGWLAGARSRKSRHGLETQPARSVSADERDGAVLSEHPGVAGPSTVKGDISSEARGTHDRSAAATRPSTVKGDISSEARGTHDLYGGMGKSRTLVGGYLKSLRMRPAVSEDMWERLEEVLLSADIGLATTEMVLGSLHERVKAEKLRDPADIVSALKAEILSCFNLADGVDGASRGATRSDLESGSDNGSSWPGRGLTLEDGAVNVWLFAGVNGVGKTTTIGKIAMAQAAGGRSVLLAAGDTFRAAAGEQLVLWGERAGVEVVRGKEGGDPGAVVFDSIEKARARGCNLVLADTAGRLHTNVNLVEELKKIHRVATRAVGKVAEVLLVLDATTGQNGMAQARQFTDAVGITGVVLTKLDGTARGGIVVAIERELGIPVKLVGIGEGPDDLIAFDPSEFVEALFG
ncbi:MAG: signal recognition particle-docking protein FtsY [Actinobacteria bacterium]|nr:signal recognition particle-docking protein FtsY [Actinomycetota bacterium]MCL5446356.1 signal recognition particle-docking protein FtsY [Actinomycetota bacterium]